MSDFIEALKTEIADLEGQLAADPRYLKLREANRLLALYTQTRKRPRDRSPAASGTRPFSSGVSAKILKAATELLEGRAEPMPTRDILIALVALGVDVGGAEPRNTLSSILSKSGVFVPHGRNGWTLKAANGHDNEMTGDDKTEVEPSPVAFEHRLDQPVGPLAQGREAVPGGGT